MDSVVDNKSSVLHFKILELSSTLEINWECDIMEDTTNTLYDTIIGRDVLKELKIDVYSSNLTVSMGNVSMSWKPRNKKVKVIYSMQMQIWMTMKLTDKRKFLMLNTSLLKT